MRTKEEIRELHTWEVNEHHASSRQLQDEDWKYYKDTFLVTFIKEPYKAARVGLGAEIIDVPTSHIITNEPRVYVEATADNDIARKHSFNRGAFLNHLISRIRLQNPEPIKESVKNALACGEGWINIVNNPDWVGQEPLSQDIPLIFSTPDPRIVFASPDERNGIPDYCFLSFKRHFQSVINKYHQWTNPLKRRGKNRYVDWFAYFDKDIRYFEADGEPVLGDIQPNLLGFTPFVHFYSGYGKSSPEGRPEELAVSRIRPVKGRILLYTELMSSLASQQKLYSHKRYDFQPASPEIEQPPDFEYDLNYGTWNWIPYGINPTERGGTAPGGDVFAFLQMLRYEITRATPPILQGIGSGSSGRANEGESKHGLAQYQSVVDNASIAWGVALSQALSIIKNSAFDLLPLTLRATLSDGARGKITLTEEDIDDTHCEVKLKASDPIEDKAQTEIGMRMWTAGAIDWETNLIKYQGYSVDEAHKIIVKTMGEQFIKSSPQLLTAMSMAALQEQGIEIPQMGGGGSLPTTPVPYAPGARGGEPRKGNIKSVEAFSRDAGALLGAQESRMPPGLGEQ